MQKRSRGRPPLETPRQLLVAVARVMLQRKVTRWRAACIVASSREGKSFYTSRTIAEDSLSRRLNDAFARDAKSLLAAAGRILEIQRRYDGALADLQAALSRGETPLLATATGGALGAWRDAAKAAQSVQHGVAALGAGPPEQRLMEQAIRQEREAQRLAEQAIRHARETLAPSYHSYLFTSMRTK